MTVIPNLSAQNISLFLLGCAVYFILEYKTKKDAVGFQIGFWVKDNWYNIVISLAFMFAYLINTTVPEGWIVFVMGACPNYVIDRVNGLISKYNSKGN